LFHRNERARRDFRRVANKESGTLFSSGMSAMVSNNRDAYNDQRTRLLNGVSRLALSTASMIVALGVCLPGEVQAQAINPVQNTTFSLTQSTTIFGNGPPPTNIDTRGGVTDAVDGAVGTAWTVTVDTRAKLLGGNNGILIASDGSSISNAGTISGANVNGIRINGKNGTVTNTGTISGPAGVVIAGDNGSVTNAGTISSTLGSGSSVIFLGAGTNTLTLQSGSTLNGNARGSTATGATNNLILQGGGTANNDFAGFNSLTIQSGLWRLNGNSAVGTATNTGAGAALIIGDPTHPGATLTGDLILDNGMLGGQGTVDGKVTLQGGSVLRPGHFTPFSTFHVGAAVSRDITFLHGDLDVTVNAAGQSDKLVVTGKADLSGGGVVVREQNGTYAPSTRYTILTAAGGLNGTRFVRVFTDFAFLNPTLIYGATDVTLQLDCKNAGACQVTQNGGGGGTTLVPTGFGFAAVAQTRNQAAVATALDKGPVTNPLIVALLNQTAAGARQAFDALSGEVFGTLHNTQGEEAQFARSAMLSRMRQISYGGIPGDLGALGFGGPALAYASGDAYAADLPAKAAPGSVERSRGLTFWAQGLGGWGRADSDGNAASLRSRFGGFLSGVDARFGDTWRAGLVAGYLRSDLHVDDRSSSAGIDSVQFGAYATGKVGAFNVRGGASYSLDEINASRGIFFPGFTDQTHARFHGNVGQVFGEVGYGMAFGRVAVEPLAGLAYVHVHDNSFLESGGVAALSGAKTNEDTGYSSLGVRMATAMPLANGTVLVPRATLQWQHAFGDVTPTSALAFQGTGAAFTIAGIPIARDAALVEAGFDWRFSPHAKLGAFYQGELAAHADTHAVKGTFTWDF
jgi:outer membrane autotransporter protein